MAPTSPRTKAAKATSPTSKPADPSLPTPLLGCVGPSARIDGRADAELSAVLEIAVGLFDDLHAVVCHVGHQVLRDVPDVGAVVGNVVHDAALGKDVVAGTAEEEQVDVALSGGVPGNIEGLACYHRRGEVREEEWVALVLARGQLVAGFAGRSSSLSGGQEGKEGRDGEEEAGIHLCNGSRNDG